MSEAIIYDITGKILRTVSAPIEMIEMQKQENEFLIYGNADISSQYIKDGEVTDKLIQETTIDKVTLVADGIDYITISNSPIGTVYVIDTINKKSINAAIQSTETFSTTIPSTYKLRVEAFPYLDFEAIIEAI